ncbi:MAG: hypothetical protein AAGJ93_05395 [Bacteroidota bacterium]
MNKWLISLCFLISLLYSACTYDQLPGIDVCDNELSLSLLEQTPPACGIASGELVIAVAGEAPGIPITYSLNGAEFKESSTFTDLLAGSYTITAKQGACEAILEVILENAAGLKASADASPSSCGASSGTITINTEDANGQVSFTLDGGAEQTSATFTGLAPGSYQITAIDEIGCQVNLEATVKSDVDFADIKAIVSSSCAISGCHAGNVSPDFRVDDNILNEAQRIGSRTGNRSMPPASSQSSLSDDQIEAIQCWIEDGASG